MGSSSRWPHDIFSQSVGDDRFLLLTLFKNMYTSVDSHQYIPNIEPIHYPWWRYQMETFSALLAICAANSSVTGKFLAQGPVTRTFDVFFDCDWIDGWVNNGEAGDWRRYRSDYDVIVMTVPSSLWDSIRDFTEETPNFNCIVPCSILRPRQNGRHFADGIIKSISLTGNIWIWNEISLKYAPRGQIYDMTALVQIMAWHPPGDKP